jgi:hypothetical protein
MFKIAYWLGLIAEIIIRAPYQKGAREGLKTDQCKSRTEDILLGLLYVALIFLPLIYSVTNWLTSQITVCPRGWAGSAYSC